jgi:predicted  nucleic acid-binding Zn-ribbon protein
MSKGAREFLEKVAKTLEEIAALDQRISTLNEERSRLSNDQARIRENMNVLRDSPKERTLRDQFIERLAKAVERIDEIDRLVSEATKSRAEIHGRLAREVQQFRE